GFSYPSPRPATRAAMQTHTQKRQPEEWGQEEDHAGHADHAAVQGGFMDDGMPFYASPVITTTSVRQRQGPTKTSDGPWKQRVTQGNGGMWAEGVQH
ncbi:uncharacterized protein EI97DRAFT_435618, partial [Westerdykella ornata]